MSPKEILPVFTEASYRLSPWSGQTISGIEDEAVKHSLQLKIYADTEGALCRDNLPEVVIATSGKSDWNINMVAALENAGKRIVLAGLEPENFGEHISGAAFNRKDSVEIIIRYFYSCGRKKIAFFGIDKNSTNDMLRLDAFEQMLTAMGKDDPSRDIFFVENIIEECYSRFSANINLYDAVICPNDVVACYFITKARKNGIRIPEDIYVSGFGNMLLSRICTPGITTFSHDYYNAGVEAFNIWNYLIKNPSVVSMRIVVKDEMLIRGSTADSAPMIPPLQRIRPVSTLKEKFFSDPHMKEIVMIESCLKRCDALDMKIIDGIAGGRSYETLADELFVSPGTIHYRASAIYRASGVAGRSSFEDLLSRYIDPSVKISDFF